MRILSPPGTISAAVALLLLSTTHRADAVLVVNQNLGTLGLGTINLTGDTANGANNADIYTSAGTSDTANWGNEWVYEFTITSTHSLSIQSNVLTGDPDVFLLNDLGTTPFGAKNNATGGLGFAFLDGVPPETASFGNLDPGTYYLSIDSFIGFDGGVVPGDATFDYDLIIGAPITAPPSLYLGPLVAADVPFTLDTLGSAFDTELGIWGDDGLLILTNDDETPGAVFQSELDLFAGLPAGTYTVGLGGFDTAYGDDFVAIGGDDSGLFDFNFPGGTLSDNLSAGEVTFFSFDVVPEPTTPILFGIAIAGTLLRRRRN